MINPYFVPTPTGLGWSSTSLDGTLSLRIEPRGLFKDNITEGKRWIWWNVLSKGRKLAYGKADDHRQAVACAVEAGKALGLAMEQLPHEEIALY